MAKNKGISVVEMTRERLKEVMRVLSLADELWHAAETYYSRYCQDEAGEDGVYVTGCSQQQHEDAKRLRDAIFAARGNA